MSVGDDDELSMLSSDSDTDIDMSRLLKESRTSKKHSTSTAVSPIKEDRTKSRRIQLETRMYVFLVCSVTVPLLAL